MHSPVPAPATCITALLALQQLAAGVLCQQQPEVEAQPLHGTHLEDTLAFGRRLQQESSVTLGAGQSEEATGRISQAFAVEGKPQALNVEFYMQQPVNRDEDEVAYISKKLLPAAIHTVQRSVRVRKLSAQDAEGLHLCCHCSL